MTIRLSEGELECLRQLHGPQAFAGGCSDTLLRHLTALGLLEQVTVQPLPILPQRYAYRLTARGRDLLSGTKG